MTSGFPTNRKLTSLPTDRELRGTKTASSGTTHHFSFAALARRKLRSRLPGAVSHFGCL